MSIHAGKIRALFKKDMKDALKNGNVLLLAALPLLFTALYRFMSIDGMQMDGDFVMTLGLLMTLTMLPVATISMMIAEEKEKNTLRTLMLSNVSAAEFLISKALTIYLVMLVVDLAIFFLTGQPIGTLPRFVLVTSLTSISMILLGALIGIISRNQMSTGMYSAPVMLVLLLPAVFATISEGFRTVAQFIPSYAMMELISNSSAGMLRPLLVIIGWTVAMAALFAVVYRRKQFD